ncbi:hypothetical protein RI129_011508 [Pyrocoelia pectoralis]|uniref:MADF domain-containing protein n=1 Tax=Pyrocoelia pectoralis TaxID=417401 RepID=A0AAN7V5R7_9COLE
MYNIEKIQICGVECYSIERIDSPYGHYDQLEEEKLGEVQEEKSKIPDPQFNSWDEILIAMVHDRPVLWDSRLPMSTRCKTERDKLWKEISDALEKSVETLQKKWRNLRDTYIRCEGETEMHVTSGSSPEKQRKPWKFYNSMKFLTDVIAPRSTISNLISPTSCSSQEIVCPSKKIKPKVLMKLEGADLTAIESLPVPNVTQAKVNPICQQLSTILDQLPIRKKAKLEIEFLTKAYGIANRNAQDSRQLVRTQSLGSVGAQTVDSVWRSDDNSSCGSDAHSINEINLAARKQKQKEWFETSLDGPAPSTPTRSHSVMSSTLQSSIASISPEEKYMEMNPHKSPLEIPSESKRQPSPTVHEPNMELFNNNIPKHGTLIQAGQCKPYHEETKPCEMDRHHWHNVGNLNETFVEENPNAVQKVIYQPLQAMTCQPFSPNKKVIFEIV